MWCPPRRQLRGSSCPQSPSQPPRTIRGWQKVRKTLVPPQGRIKTPYVPGLDRCSCGVTPFAVPSLPPCTCRASITGADSPYSPGCPRRGVPSRPVVTPGAFGEGAGRRVGLDSVWSPKPCSRRDPAHVRCHSFAEAFVMQLPLFWEQEGKEALKFSLTLSGFSFQIFLPCDE